MKHSATRFAAIVATFGLLLVVSSQLSKAQRGAPASAPARSPDADWPMHNRDLAGTRYSPLNQINTNNVATLVKAWSFKLQPDNGPALTGSEVFQEVTPIVVNGVMYMPAGNRIVALEPETGKEVWRYELKGRPRIFPRSCLLAWRRSYWSPHHLHQREKTDCAQRE